MKVLIVAEIPLYRDGIAEALRRLHDVELVATAATGVSAVPTARRTECDVVLVDMAVGDSTQIVASLLAARPGLKVVALGAPDDGPEVACAEAGICGYLSREATLIDVADVLRSTMRADAPVPDKMAAGPLEALPSMPAHNIPASSPTS